MKRASVETEPLWYQNAVFYELPVKSFFDGNNDGLGDFAGLTRKLDYLAEMGITCVWLLPFSPSPWRDDGYDVSNYRDIHPAYGSLAEFHTFVQAAHERGIRVAAEMAINHTSDAHPWFQAARTAPPESPLRQFYLWSDTPDQFRDAEVLHGDGKRSNWTWDAVAQAYYWHRFFEHQPDLNYDNPRVRAEMLKVLRFWLDRGVDGLCLNGVSYLMKREGTRCENLPETHGVLKEMRRELEAAYPGRVLQAGVSAWPAEARSYFGDGDECHLVANLPLAQRLFLAVRQEDRFAVADLLRKTPSLPLGCQWVVLLRNHDELTLKLTTDEERDYLLREYAADRRMRLHDGIRRRLAPLLENSRQRIELLFGLVFSLPGAPVVYYGDEIGMGDNIYLIGRNSVRTPMQWSADGNAGFSATDFARLFAPPVMDPLYGYQAVNVESERRDPSSLFHWVRRLIALRKHTPALGRGRLQLLEPSNRKILAFLRLDGEDVILIVANLARSMQPVELNLSAFAGLVPVEMFARTALPAIAAAPYFLTLGAHAFYWFQLRKAVSDVAARLAPVETEEIKTIPVVKVAGGWETVLEGTAREELERTVLPEFLRAQRWFGGKGRRVEEVRLLDWGDFPAAESRVFLLLLEVHFAGGKNDLYFLPVGATSGEAAARMLQARKPWAIARLSGPAGEALLHDALADDDTCMSLLAAIGSKREFALRLGQVRAFPTAAFDGLGGRSDRPLPVVRAPATSSNSLIFYGRRLLLKLFRRLETGINPDYEIGRFLTERNGFTRIPLVAGALEYRPRVVESLRDSERSRGATAPHSEPITLAILQSAVANQGDGWKHAVDELDRYYERASGRMSAVDPVAAEDRPLLELAESVPSPAALEVIGAYLHTANTLGQRTAELHRALAADADNPDFAPQPFTADDAAALHQSIGEQSASALAALRDNLDRLPENVASPARQLLEQGPKALRRLRQQTLFCAGAAKIRCHGDYHLGQVLRVENDYFILDFEGEPLCSVAERRAKQSPLKDVAGMIRSYHYAAYAGLFAFTQNRPEDFDRLVPWAELWYQWVSAAFLRAYRAAAIGQAFLPAETAPFAALLDAFMLVKAFYELNYELNNRPDWVRIPLRGILTLLPSMV